MRAARALRILLFAAAMSLMQSVPAADDIRISEFRLREADEGLFLDADFDFDLNARLAQAVSNGVALYFAVEFELSRPRWYWFDERASSRRMELRLSYHALSRRFRLSSGLLQQNFNTLQEALGVLRRVRGWLVAERIALTPDAHYEASVRMRLDLSLLPKPIQVSALTTGDWTLESGWRRMGYRAQQQLPAPVESREPKGVPGQ